MSSAAERILDALRDRDCHPQEGAGGQWSARCPAHKDHSPSLSARQIEGQALIFCHAGCATGDVMAALGLSVADLYDEPAGVRYTYPDGRVVHRSPDKRFRQSGRTRGGACLYRLDRVREAVAAGRTVYVAEGEKDVHALEAAGVVATCSPMGAGKWHKVDPFPLASATVVVVADDDEPGHRHAADVRDSLRGIGAAVTVVKAKTGKDAADHIAAGYGPQDFIPLPTAEPELEIVTASAIRERRVVYLWEQRIPLGAFTLLPGEEGIGKTLVGIRLMADLTRGVLAGEFRGEARDVLVMAPEDGIEDVFKPRLREAGADLDRVHFIKCRKVGEQRDSVILPRDLPLLTRAVRRLNVPFLWVDSLVTSLPAELKSISYKDVSTVLRAIGEWAAEQRIAVAAPWHLNKATGSDTAVRIMDSRAFRTAVRSMLLVVEDPDAPEGVQQGIVALDKVNAGSRTVAGLRYRIRSAHYTVSELDESTGELVEKPASCGVADWCGAVEGDARTVAREALAPRIEKDGGPKQWLRDYLTAVGEMVRGQVIDDARREHGHSEAAIKRAARALGVHSREVTGRDDRGRPFRRALWSLPQSGHCSHTRPTDPTDPTGEGSSDPTEPISAGRAKSGQWGQLGPRRESDPTGVPPGHVGGTTAPSRLHNVTRLPVRTPVADPNGCRACGQPLPPGLVSLGRTAHVSGTCPR